MQSKFLITGGCGFIGLNLIRELLSRGFNDIRIIDDLSVGDLSELQKLGLIQIKTKNEIDELGPVGIEFIKGDIIDNELADIACRGCHILVHLAANTGVVQSVHDPRSDLLTNVIGTFNYLDAAQKNKLRKFVFASSGAPIGNITPPIHENMVPRPVSPYGSSKLAGEGYCSSYFQTFNLNTVALRFGNVFGPGSRNKSSVVAQIIKNMLNGELINIYGSGDQTRDFIFITDLVDALIAAALSEKLGGEVLQIATGIETSVNEIVKLVTYQYKKVFNADPRIRHLDKRTGDVLQNYSDITKAKQYLDWEPKISLDEAIELTFDYFLNNSCENNNDIRK